MPRKLLVITEHFQVGGLETHIQTQVEHWRAQGVEVYLATQPGFHPDLLELFPSSSLLTVSMQPGLSARDWLETIQALERWIDEKGIDTVHAHPFVSLVPAFFVTQAKRLPLLISVHGPTLFEPAYGRFFQLLLEQLVLPHASGVLCVSPETAALAAVHGAGARVLVVPNTVRTEHFRALACDPDPLRKWLVVSRLDSAKAEGIRELLSLAQAIGIRQIDLVGDGEAREALATFARDRVPRLTCRFLGFRRDMLALAETETYSGVAGMGRVVLETCSMNLPVLLVGYDGVKGLMDAALFERAAFANFSGRGLSSLDAEQLRRAFEQLRERPADFRLGTYFRERWTAPAEEALRTAFAQAAPRPSAEAPILRDLLRLELEDPRAFFESARSHDRFLKLLFPQHPLVEMLRDRDRERESLLGQLALERAERERVQRLFDEQTASKSWRLTSPLRQGLRILRRRG